MSKIKRKRRGTERWRDEKVEDERKVEEIRAGGNRVRTLKLKQTK